MEIANSTLKKGLAALDLKQLANAAYFLIGYLAAIISAAISDQPILKIGLFAPAVLLFILYLSASLLCSGKTNPFISEYVLPVWFCRLLRKFALVLPLVMVGTAFFGYATIQEAEQAQIVETQNFIKKLELLDRQNRPADLRLEADQWISQHREDGYTWSKLTDFYLSKGQLDLALNASNEHIRLHSTEDNALKQRDEILLRIEK